MYGPPPSPHPGCWSAHAATGYGLPRSGMGTGRPFRFPGVDPPATDLVVNDSPLAELMWAPYQVGIPMSTVAASLSFNAESFYRTEGAVSTRPGGGAAKSVKAAQIFVKSRLPGYRPVLLCAPDGHPVTPLWAVSTR